jgi:hypothetical protein
MAYATTIQLARFLNLENKVPNPALTGQERTKEEVGTGDDSNTLFYLDYGLVIADSYTLYYGASESAATNTLTETTHFTLDKELGKITLTSAGVTLLSTNKLFASYSHMMNGDNLIITDTDLQNALDRADEEVDKLTSTVFADGTAATPEYGVKTNEEQAGKGETETWYDLDEFPLPDVSTTLDEAVTADDTTITVVSTDGFPSSGVIGIGSDKISYTGKTDTTFTGCTSVSAHDDGSTVYPYVIEISVTEEGTTPSWTVLESGVDYHIDLDTGRVYLYKDYSEHNNLDLQQPPYLVANRFRATYLYGYDTIPEPIKRLTLMLAAKEIEHMRLRKNNIMNVEFSSTIENLDDSWIQQTIAEYKSIKSSNI